MTTPEPQVIFYELSGPKPWSPACWCTRFALNYKRIPYRTIKLSYPSISPICTSLLPSLPVDDHTVPIIEILGPPYVVLNDSTPIAHLLNERFPEKDGYRFLHDVGFEHPSLGGKGIQPWILADIWERCLDEGDGSKEHFRRTREEGFGCKLEEVCDVVGGGEEMCLGVMRERFGKLRERMSGVEGVGEPTYWDFYEAAKLKWVETASPEKYKKFLALYGDDTFTKLLKKVEKYTYDG